MNLKQVVRALLPPILVGATGHARNMTKSFIRRHEEMVPWSPAYFRRRHQFIDEVLKSGGLLERFRSSEPLPARYGVGIDERCIEYPWLVAQLNEEPEILLDAGSAINHDFVLNNPIFRHKVIHILTLAPEANCFWQRAISYLFHDLRDIPIRNDYYDIITCISTLEHIGCDNSLYTGDEKYRESKAEDFVRAMQELRRVLKPGGRLLLTVPFGVYHNFGMFQQFDEESLSRTIDAFGNASRVTKAFYRYTAEGWNISDTQNCATCEYVESTVRIAAALANRRSPGPSYKEQDLAVAARAVACVTLVKK